MKKLLTRAEVEEGYRKYLKEKEVFEKENGIKYGGKPLKYLYDWGILMYEEDRPQEEKILNQRCCPFSRGYKRSRYER